MTPPTVAPAAARARPALSPSPSPTAPRTLASEEASLVGAIDAALRGGDGAGALGLAAEHERRFPHGALAQEREGARVVARCMSGQRSAAAASSFLAAHPRSPMRARIGAACGTEGP
jgi:rhodanese-related sulfurtransferase